MITITEMKADHVSAVAELEKICFSAPWSENSIMAELGMEPILHADMALGEGTGAVALLPMLDMALRVYHGPHTFDDLGMAAYTPQEEQA